MSDLPASPSRPGLPISPLRERRGLLLAVGLALTAALALLHIFSPLFLRQTELRLYDRMLRGQRMAAAPRRPIMVGIDEESLAAFGQWPWPRYRLARLVRALHGRGARVVAVDTIMPEPDRSSPEVIAAERQRDLVEGAAMAPVPSGDSNTASLAEALAGGLSVLGCYFEFAERLPAREGEALPALPPGMVVGGRGDFRLWPQPQGAVRSLPLLTAAASEGFTNIRHDVDGILRRTPLLLPRHGLFYPSLALATALLSEAERRLSLRRDGDETVLLWGERRIPLDRQGRMLIRFRPQGDGYPYLSAKAVLEDAPGQPSLAGATVVVGTWAKALGDIHAVGDGRSLRALEVHAAIIDTLLSGAGVSWPGWGRGAELALLLLVGGLSTMTLCRMAAIPSLGTALAASLGCYLLALFLLRTQGLFLSPLMPMATPVVLLAGLSLVKHGIESRKVRERTRDLGLAHSVIEEVEVAKDALAEENVKLAEVDRLKSMFLASMSHELRTPLNSIIGFSSLLLMGATGPLLEEQQRQLEIVKRNAMHLLDLISDVIDTSKIEAGKIDLNWGEFDLALAVREAVDSLTVLADGKGLTLTVQGPPGLMVRADERRVRQILMNLVGNAVKFTEVGGVTVVVRPEGGMVSVLVRDTGPGIREEDLGHLFRYFSQIVAGQRRQEGTGLGLYISKKLAQLLGGDILVVSEFGRGSCFTLILPLPGGQAGG